ncbi:MAG: AtpZ/AtpI family protein [Candidatus Hatepunaea meridiana]|nr:AtpZ/AtpI family protein [Candidatus Hatepunaea meridiana]
MPQDRIWNVAAGYTHLGMTLAVSILAGFFLGYWLDGKIGTMPLLTLAGAFTGATGGFIYLVQTLNKLQKKSEEEDEEGQVNG